MIAALILAAGASQRMGGQPKALLSVAGTTLLERVTATARQAGTSGLVVVVGPPHEALIRQRFVDAELEWAHNPQPERGMLSSVQAGLPKLPAAARGALIWPVDVPFVDVSTVRTLLDAPLDAQMVVPVWQGRGGHPLWLPRRLFAEAMALSPEVGLRALRQDHPPLRIDVKDAEILRDLDTPEDLAAARARWERA